MLDYFSRDFGVWNILFQWLGGFVGYQTAGYGFLIRFIFSLIAEKSFGSQCMMVLASAIFHDFA
jgi:hypothetical protein